MRRVNRAVKARLCCATACLLGSALLAGGCYRGGPDAEGADEGGTDGDDPAAQCADNDLGASHWRRLTREQYHNTLRELLALPEAVAIELVDDQSIGPFATNELNFISDLAVEQVMLIAEDMAAAADLAVISPCDPQAGGASCATEFIETFGRRAFRRPLLADEVARYEAVYADVSGSDGPDAGLRQVLAAMLVSPNFLYLVELGDGTGQDGDVVALSQYEVASRLSYFLWSSMPDDALLDAAERGELSDPTALEDQARRMLDDPRAEATLASFHRQWLGVDLGEVTKDSSVFPNYGPPMAGDFERELELFVLDVLQRQDARFETLMTASYAFASKTSAPVYGIDPDTIEAGQFARVELDPSRRGGVLTQAGALTAHAGPVNPSVVLRGKFIRENILCQPVSPPPAGVDATPPQPDPSLSPRQQWQQHVEDPSCGGCHLLMDPIGFAFEHYDALGQWRDRIGTWEVDANGELNGTDVDGTYDGAVAMVQALAGSVDAQQCMATQWFRFALGRQAATEDECAQQNLDAAFVASDGDIRELLIDLATSTVMTRRRLPLAAP